MKAKKTKVILHRLKICREYWIGNEVTKPYFWYLLKSRFIHSNKEKKGIRKRAYFLEVMHTYILKK